MTPEKTWHAVYTRPGCEKKVSQLLSAKNIECYCALNRVTHSSISRKSVFQSLFPAYVFVRIYESEKETVKRIKGVVNFVYWLSSPVMVRDEEMDAIKYFLHEHANVKLEKIKVSVSERVKVIEGPALLPDPSSEHKNQSIRVTLPSLGVAMMAEARVGTVEMVQQYKKLFAKIA